MPMHNNENKTEQPVSIKLVQGYLEQIDLFGPAFVKAARDYRDAGISTISLARQTILGAVQKTGYKPPFINTVADIAEGVFSIALKFQGAAVEAGVEAHRRVAQSVLNTLTGKTSA